jgi:hypothetical protein
MISGTSAKNILKSLLPHGIVMATIRSKAVRRARMSAISKQSVPNGASYSYSSAIEFHCARGLPRQHVVEGSIPEKSLEFCGSILDQVIQADRPPRGLHLGNFVGESLVYFAAYVRARDDKAVIVSIDPNLPHRGIDDPQKHTIALLNHFNLQSNVIICVGYSGQKSVSNDGFSFISTDGFEYDSLSHYSDEQSCQNSLTNLALLYESRFDFAVMDGNHDAEYLRSEVDVVRRLLTPNGILLLDDVSEAWADIKAEYGSLASKGWKPLGADGRVGALQKI